MNYELTHARHDPAHCLAPGLFRSLKRGDRKKLKLDISYPYGNESIRFWGPEPLGVDDLRVLQGLVAMAGVSGASGAGIDLLPDTKSVHGQALRHLLDLKWEATDKKAMVVQGSFGQLARELGYADSGGAQFKTIRDCIERLWAVSVIVDHGGRRQGFRILSQYASDRTQGQLLVALNPRLSEALVGGHSHTRIDMKEVRALRTDPARLLHQRLCGWINPGDTRAVKLETLCSYVWPEEANPEAMKKRRKGVCRALDELKSIGWGVTGYAKEKWRIQRPGPRRNIPRSPA